MSTETTTTIHDLYLTKQGVASLCPTKKEDRPSLAMIRFDSGMLWSTNGHAAAWIEIEPDTISGLQDPVSLPVDIFPSKLKKGERYCLVIDYDKHTVTRSQGVSSITMSLPGDQDYPDIRRVIPGDDEYVHAYTVDPDLLKRVLLLCNGNPAIQFHVTGKNYSGIKFRSGRVSGLIMPLESEADL